MNINRRKFYGHQSYLHRGMTIIELSIYSTLLSFLVTGFLYFSISIHINDTSLIHEIQDEY